MLDILKLVPQFSEWVKIEPLLKGWSSDKKYYIENRLGEKFLLRLAEQSKYTLKKVEYENLNKLIALNIPMTSPIDFGFVADYVYTLFKWIEGKDAEEKILKFSESEQYRQGIEAGRILRKIHSIKKETQPNDWEERYRQKILKKIVSYETCDIKIPHGETFIKFINNHLEYLKNRPQTFQHGDYHLGNFLITNDNNLAILDFNRYDFGDPYEEFNRITFSSRISKAFSRGQIDGYFEGNVPDNFFPLLALYVAVNAISSVPWAIPFGNKEIQFMLSQVQETYEMFKGFTGVIPTWYK